MALSIKALVYNAFQVNTYVIWNAEGSCIVVDPSCYSQKEQEHLADFIKREGLSVADVINTHSHVDHVLGNSFMFHRYGKRPLIHSAGLVFYDTLTMYANSFGFELDEVVTPENFLEDQQVIMLGEEAIRIAYTPGHADGSICLIHEAGHWIVSGDLLFLNSIGRTDLPTGSLETLLKSVHQKLFIYPDDYRVYPGHGSPTTIGYERRNNPYL